MNRKLKPTKYAQQIKEKQISFLLEDIEKDIAKYKKIIETKNRQLAKVKERSRELKIATRT